jgi:hypothetical protein
MTAAPWMVQWNAKVPPVVKVLGHVPDDWVGEWVPSAKVTLWSVPPGFHTQVTVVPTGTVRLVGEKRLFPTVTSFVPEVLGVVTSDPPEHAPAARTIRPANNSRLRMAT